MKSTCADYIAVSDLSGSTTFFTLSQKWHNLKKKIICHEMCIMIFSTTFV